MIVENTTAGASHSGNLPFENDVFTLKTHQMLSKRCAFNMFSVHTSWRLQTQILPVFQVFVFFSLLILEKAVKN